jgi:hypothetical protein
MSELHASEPQPPACMPVAYECPECGQVWTVLDDAEEWAYGHDCEIDESPVRVIVPEERWVDDEEYTQIGDHPGTTGGQR